MPLIYCDHNYVVTALQEPQTYHAHLRQLVATGALTFTLSPMHWVEAAEDTNLARGDASGRDFKKIGFALLSGSLLFRD